jgi:hypothetical protein
MRSVGPWTFPQAPGDVSGEGGGGGGTVHTEAGVVVGCFAGA